MPQWTKLIKANITSSLTSDTSSSLPHFFRMLENSHSLNVFKSEYLTTWNCSWLLTAYLFSWNIKMVCRSLYKHENHVLISNFLQLETELYREKQKLKIMVFKIICFSIDYGVSDSLFTHLWTSSTAFILVQVKASFYTPIFNYLLLFLYKSGMIPIVYHKYVNHLLKSLPAFYAMRKPWNNFVI